MGDKLTGSLIFLASLAGLVCYFYLVFLSHWVRLVIEVTAFLAVAAVLFIVAWIGYTMVTVSPPEAEEFTENLEEDLEPE